MIFVVAKVWNNFLDKALHQISCETETELILEGFFSDLAWKRKILKISS